MDEIAHTKKVLYGIQGQGRGHASRSLHIINQLMKKDDDVHVFSGGDALTLLDGKRMAINHQQIFLETKLPRLNNTRKSIKLLIFKLMIKILAGKPDRIITSSFYHFVPKH